MSRTWVDDLGFLLFTIVAWGQVIAVLAFVIFWLLWRD